ncbi:nicotinate phosphoribosyltransferase [Tuanshanicoccus lijuaniae]|nr:nicotinate phosphoribosyltransferase [Aerococcaceae bacterium zg-1292]MBF6625407.1 nicotinate phosphoribosyltransferase [Aerococcaceae bacterium zg-BR9]MBS4456361.1 nicotinate phosphoribosyltransferase [Aerococcaceae bacterium zg-A91]MBS4458223.1 nicotinate phosphoribosyltransferase [Aerococcaceae bacterium zg-BR33]QQA37171.1 nicotinate phosphoribosyltransferase [Aerococcaceae bacterium zg-1292]
MFNHPDDSLTLHTDLYQINMLKTYWDDGIVDRHAVFEAYFRKNPFDNGYAVFAGLERIVHYLQALRFSEADIEYLRSLNMYPEAFLNYLSDFKFTCSVRSLVEGELCFANEPLIQVEGPLGQCQLVETALLNILNYQTLVATKASRIRSVIGEDDKLSEFGTRRAQEMEAAIWGTRAAYIGGFDTTSNVRASKLFGIPVSGTHAHSLVQAYRDEYTAFKKYAESHKDVVFLVDTYDTLRSGVPTAIRVAQEMGDKINFKGVRIDSGDMAYQSKRIREQLDEAGFPDAHIIASNDLDEKFILNLRMQGAKIDDWGVGTKLITAFDQPSLGAVYKLVSIEDENGTMVPTMKISSNAEKMSTPGVKQVWRITRNSDGKSEGDYIALIEERPDQLEELYMFHPVHTYINKTVKDFTAKPLLVDIFKEGSLVYELPTLEEIKQYANKTISALWDEYKRILNPEKYPVDLSQKLYDEKMDSIKEIRQKVDKFVADNELEQS